MKIPHRCEYWRRRLLCLALGLTSAVASAAPDNITRGEMALLPEYCPYTQTFNTGDARTAANAERWRAAFGSTFSALHHYCWGLISIKRSKGPGMSGLSRQGLLMSAINDFNYVVQFSTPSFVLLPEVYFRIGETQLELGAYGAALDAFTLSRQAKPAYWPPYLRWSETLVKLGKKPEALAHLEAGLRLMPTERALIAPYERLGGNYAKWLQALPAPSPASAASGTTP